MATLPFPVIPLIDGDKGIYHSDNHDSLLFGNAPPALDGSGAGPVAPEFARTVQAMAAGEESPNLIKLSEAFIGDVVQLLEAKGSLQDGYTAVETLRHLLENQDKLSRELIQVVFRSLGAVLPGAQDPVPASALASQMQRLVPRLTLPADVDPMQYVRHKSPREGTAVDQRQAEEPQTTYAQLHELLAILDAYTRRIKGRSGQKVELQAGQTLASLVNKTMHNAASTDELPRVAVIGMHLGQRFLTHNVRDLLDQLMLAITARFATEPEDLSHQLLKPLNDEVLIRIWQASQRLKNGESQVFTSHIQPELRTEILRTALRADHARAVTLDPRQLRAGLQTPMLGSALVRKAIFGSELAYNRWLMVAERMQQVEARRPGTFRALSLQAPSEGEAHGLVFAPATLAHFMSDPASTRALLQALRAPGQLAQSQVAMRLREESIEEMNGEVQARTS